MAVAAKDKEGRKPLDQRVGRNKCFILCSLFSLDYDAAYLVIEGAGGRGGTGGTIRAVSLLRGTTFLSLLVLQWYSL